MQVQDLFSVVLGHQAKLVMVSTCIFVAPQLEMTMPDGVYPPHIQGYTDFMHGYRGKMHILKALIMVYGQFMAGKQ